MFGKNLDKIVCGLVAAGGNNTGIILLSVGVILFAISLPSKRLRLKADDRRMLSTQIIKDMAENRHL